MVTFVGVGSYSLSWAGTVTCCCGDHAGDDSCGCPTCPAAQGEDDEQAHETQLRSCGGAALIASGQSVELLVGPESLIIHRAPSVRVPLLYESVSMPPLLPLRPEAPDS
jgi:hypothetical protein